MHHGNSRGNGKQRLEELFKLTFFDRFIKKTAQVEVVRNNSMADNFFEQIVEPFKPMTIFFKQITRAI